MDFVKECASECDFSDEALSHCKFYGRADDNSTFRDEGREVYDLSGKVSETASIRRKGRGVYADWIPDRPGWTRKPKQKDVAIS